MSRNFENHNLSKSKKINSIFKNHKIYARNPASILGQISKNGDEDGSTPSLVVQIFQICFVLIGIAAWAFGIQPLMFVIPVEVLPVRYKSLSQRVTHSVVMIGLYLQGLSLPKIELMIGSYVFLIFAACNFVSAVYLYFRMIESRGVESERPNFGTLRTSKSLGAAVSDYDKWQEENEGGSIQKGQSGPKEGLTG